MNQLWDAIRSSPLWVTILAWGSLSVLVLKLLLLDHVHAPLQAFADLSKLGDDLLTANFAAYLFYLFSVQIPLVQNKQQLGPLLDKNLSTIAHASTAFLKMLTYSKQQSLPGAITRAEIDRLFSSTDPNATSLMSTGIPSLKSMTWLQAMSRHFDLVGPAIVRTLRQSRFLDAELLRLLNDIEDAPIVESLHDTLSLIDNGTKLQNTSLSAWTDNFWERYQLDQKLSQYRERLSKHAALG